MAIVSEDSLYTLRCTGCGARVSLHKHVVRDPFLRVGRIEAMKAVHAKCDGYKDAEAAKRAMKDLRAGVKSAARARA